MTDFELKMKDLYKTLTGTELYESSEEEINQEIAKLTPKQLNIFKLLLNKHGINMDDSYYYDEVQDLIDKAKSNTFSENELMKSPIVIIKEQTLDSDKIKKYEAGGAEAKQYEPDNLDDYIGQTKAKESVKTAVKIIQQLKPIHLLINGWAGCGKTLLAKLIAKMLDANIIYRIPEQLSDVDDLLKVLNEIQESEQLTVLFVDEIHNIDKKLVNILLPILQDWKFGDTNIKKFVFIGATTDKDILCKKYSPLVSRFQKQITLEKYKDEELIQIIKNYKDQSYPQFNISENDYNVIAKNSRGIPRESISLLLSQLVTSNMDIVLEQSDIIKDGLTSIDIKILRTLNESSKPVGASCLSQSVGIPMSDYVHIYERYLIEKGFIFRGHGGRRIRDKGIKLLKQLKKGGK